MIAWAFRVAVLGFALAVALVAPPSRAQSVSDTDRATARELGREGLTALDAGDMARANERLTKALALLDVPTLRVARARALRGLGRFVAAAEDCQAALRYRLSPNDPPVFTDAQQNATKELAELEPITPRLTIQLSGGTGSVTVDGVAWPPAVMGVARPLDPGEHRVEVSNASGQSQAHKVVLATSQREVLTLQVPQTKGASAGFVGGSKKEPSPAPPAEPPAEEAKSGDHTATYVVAGATLAVTAAAVVTGILALGAKSEFDDNNRSDVSNSKKTDLRDKASTLSVISTALFGAAVVGGGISTYLILSSGEETSTAGAPRLTGFGLAFRGQL